MAGKRADFMNRFTPEECYFPDDPATALPTEESIAIRQRISAINKEIWVLTKEWDTLHTRATNIGDFDVIPSDLGPHGTAREDALFQVRQNRYGDDRIRVSYTGRPPKGIALSVYNFFLQCFKRPPDVLEHIAPGPRGLARLGWVASYQLEDRVWRVTTTLADYDTGLPCIRKPQVNKSGAAKC